MVLLLLYLKSMNKPTHEQFIRLFPDFSDSLHSITQLEGDASTRRYYLIQTITHPLVLMEMEPFFDPPPFITIATYLSEMNIPVPRIIGWNGEKGYILLEYLGNTSLFNWVQNTNETEIINQYRVILDQLSTLQQSYLDHPISCPVSHLVFNADRWLYELYFMHIHLIQHLLNYPIKSSEEQQWFDFYHTLALSCEGKSKTFVHRDFHSKNIMLHNNIPYWIDFQDARLGNPLYDLASLLYDSYVTLPQNIQTKLATQFFDSLQSKDSEEAYFSMLHTTALQRNLKACGTFAYMAVVRNNPLYLHYLKPTFSHIRTHLIHLDSWSFVLNGINNLEALLLEQFPETCVEKKSQ